MLTGLNISFPIYFDVNGVQTSFHGIVLRKAVVDSVVMSLSDKITGDVIYNGSDLEFSMKEYVIHNGVKYYMINPPTVLREGLVKDNSDLKGATKYSFEFYHPMFMLGNFPFTDVAVSFDEQRYKSQDKTFSWIGYPQDYVNKLNKNLEGTEWVVVMSDRFPEVKANTLSEVLSFDNATIADALKTGYDTWDVPYVVDKLNEGEYSYTTAQYPSGRDYYADGKRFVIVFGLPSNEIYENATQAQLGTTPFVFQFGQGVGLKNNSRTPRNNKIVTRIAGYGSERNIPYGYPQIRWYGSSDATCTIGDSVGAKENVTINGTTYDWAMSYPIYDGIVGGQYVKLIKHPFTRKHLMPSVYAEAVFNKVSQYTLDSNDNVVANPNYDPDIEIKDYYDAIGETGYEYPNEINTSAPSYEMHEFEDIYPELGEAKILGAAPINADLTDADAWDDTMDDDGNYLQSYFKLTLPQLSFDIYACAAITEEMQINMRSGACIGCTFTVQVDWEDYKLNFYNSNGDFDPVAHTSANDGHVRDITKYPDSSQGSITIIVQKDNNTFGTLMPNIYQHPQGESAVGEDDGDAFVVLGISLPLSYIEDSQERLDGAMKSYMLENNVHYFDYPLKFDEYMLANNTYILNQIRPNSIIRFEYNDEELELFVKQLTIKYNEGVLPQYDITLTDNIEVVLNQIGKVADDVEHLGSLLAMLRQDYSNSSSAEIAKKLSKVYDDAAGGHITFTKGATFSNRGFSSGFLGYGAKVDSDGKGEFEEVTVRGSLRAAELTFNLIDAEEGEAIRSIGHGEIESVTISTSTTGIAILKLDGDQWATIDVGDICRGMYNTIGKDYDNASSSGTDSNGFQNKKGFFASYFKVTSVTSSKGSCRFGYELQTSHGNPACEHPCPLMRFAVYGNTNSAKPERQSCMYISAVGISPRELYLAGVNDWAIKPENIKIASGNIEGLYVWNRVTQEEYDDSQATVGVGKKTWTVDGETYYAILEELHGDAGFYCEDNIYLGGIINQLKAAAIDAVSASVTNLGQAWVWTNISEKFIDCDEDGYPLASTLVSIHAKLYFGNNECVLDQDPSKCYIDGFMFSSRTFNGDYEIYRNITVGTSSVLNSEMVRVFLTGTYNGNEYTAIKTVPVVANRQGVTGADGVSVASISSNEEYFTVECGSDGKALSSNSLALTASLMVGNNAATLDTRDSYFGYNQMANYPTFSQNDTIASKTITIASGATPESEITIVLKGTYGDNTYNLSKKIPIFAIKRGADGTNGDDGVGIASVATYYLLTTMYEGVTTSTTGWTTTYSEPNEAFPYLWRYTLYTYDTDPVTTYATPCELIYTYNATPNPNLLDDTEFLGSGYMDAWDSIGVGVGTTGAAAPTISYNSVASLGHNRFGIAYNPRNTDGYIEYLYQSLYNTDKGIYKIEASTWYTLSFWLYSGTGYTQSDHWLDFNMNGLYDSTAGRYLDGVAYTSNQAVIHFSPTNSWVKHTVSFKTPSSLTSPVKFKLQMYSRTYNQNIQVCMPKLEVGRIATPYVSAKSVTEPMARTSTWEAGKQYYKGATGEPYMDIVAKNGKWYRCLRTHLSTNSNAPVDSTETAYWSPANNFDFIATDLLLADQAVINLVFSQKILMRNENNQLTASINDDEKGSYCIYYPQSGAKQFEFSSTRQIISYNDDDANSIAWWLGNDGVIHKADGPKWSSIYLYRFGGDEPDGDDFNGHSIFTLTKYPVYIAGVSGVQDKNGKIYASDFNTLNVPNSNYIPNGWYTDEYAPVQVISTTEGTDMWELHILHIESGSITERKSIYTTNSGT